LSSSESTRRAGFPFRGRSESESLTSFRLFALGLAPPESESPRRDDRFRASGGSDSELSCFFVFLPFGSSESEFALFRAGFLSESESEFALFRDGFLSESESEFPRFRAGFLSESESELPLFRAGFGSESESAFVRFRDGFRFERAPESESELAGRLLGRLMSFGSDADSDPERSRDFDFGAALGRTAAIRSAVRYSGVSNSTPSVL
jgi:hypothetical protein